MSRFLDGENLSSMFLIGENVVVRYLVGLDMLFGCYKVNRFNLILNLSNKLTSNSNLKCLNYIRAQIKNIIYL